MVFLVVSPAKFASVTFYEIVQSGKTQTNEVLYNKSPDRFNSIYPFPPKFIALISV
jgi:hypothetical protein